MFVDAASVIAGRVFRWEDGKMKCPCPLPHTLNEINELPREAIGRLLFEVTKALLNHDPNFTAGNPSIFKLPTDIPGAELVVVMHLQGIGRPIDIGRNRPEIWTPPRHPELN
jgi:hypothetical protein